MLKWSASLVGLAALLSLSPSLHAQATPTAIRGGGDIQAGVGLTFANGDYQNSALSQNIGGISLFANYGFTHSIGLQADVHLLSVYTPNDISQKSYLVGPRYTYHRGKQSIYAKLEIGRANITYTEPKDTSRQNNFDNSAGFSVFAFGGGYEYRFKHHYNVYADAELQKWPNFEPTTLSPMLVTVGVAYIIR
jgi:hypothetical protein